MKKIFSLLSLAVLAGCLTLGSCKKEPEPVNPNGDESTIRQATITETGIRFGTDEEVFSFAATTGQLHTLFLTDENNGARTYKIAPNRFEMENIALGASVDGQGNCWTSTKGSLFSADHMEPTGENTYRMYVGLSFLDAERQEHYAWAYVELERDASNVLVATWKEAYYESTPNKPIRSGDRQ